MAIPDTSSGRLSWRPEVSGPLLACPPLTPAAALASPANHPHGLERQDQPGAGTQAAASLAEVYSPRIFDAGRLTPQLS